MDLQCFNQLQTLTVKDLKEQLTLDQLADLTALFNLAYEEYFDGYFYAIVIGGRLHQQVEYVNNARMAIHKLLKAEYHSNPDVRSIDIFTSNEKLVDQYKETEYSTDITFVGSREVFMDMHSRNTLSELQAWRFPNKPKEDE